MSKRYAHIFNPTCEMEVANGEVSYTPPSHLLKFVQDLEVLPLVYASEEDCVLVCRMPDAEFTDRLSAAGFDLPGFRLIDKVDHLSADFVPSPWGWSPAVAHLLRPLGAIWNDDLKPFFSREFALSILKNLFGKNLPRIINPSRVARYADSLTDVEKLLAEWGKVVIKAPYSSSGRGIQMLRGNQLDINIINKTRSLIKQQGGVMVEPLFEKICDFAYEFKMQKGEIFFVGYSSFSTNEKGQYEGHHIPFDPKSLPKEAYHLWDIGVINAALEELLPALQNSGLAKHFEGYFGVDALVFRDSDSNVRLQPCIEINLRNNMGIVALHLEKHIAPGSVCEFKIISNPSVSLALFDMDLKTNHPLVMDGNKIRSGYLPLTPPKDDTLSMAYLLVK